MNLSSTCYLFVFVSLGILLMLSWRLGQKLGAARMLTQSLDGTFMECKSLAHLERWYENFTASGHQMPPAELGLFIDHVSGLRAVEKWGRVELAGSERAVGFGEIFFGPDRPEEARAKQFAVAQPRLLEIPRQVIWKLGSTLWCMRAPISSVGTSPSMHALILLERAGSLIRESLKEDEPTQPLNFAF
ncbi:MAG: hypothetical protein U1B84_19990, partial [Variovorax sp.]|nr:hypothetical protein [Variovorax sp.]